MTHAPRKVLISGASIAGPTLAFWLHRYGFEVTIVERASTVRRGDYPIDLRGPSIEVAERMGILDDLKVAHIGAQRCLLIDPEGREVGSVSTEAFNGNVISHDLEVARGDLTALLFRATRDNVEYIFNDSISGLEEDDQGVEVSFDSGLRRRFDLVVGADGLHSNVRRLVFGPEKQFERYIGFYFVLFAMPNYLGLKNEIRLQAKPGKIALLNAAGRQEQLHGMLAFLQDRAELNGVRTIEEKHRLVADAYADWGWEVPRMLDELAKDDEPFFDTVSQIILPSWAKGRVALAGDAAHAPSFLSGQGTSTCLIAAFILAGEIASNPDHRTAFATYERFARPFVEVNQALVEVGRATVISTTEAEIRDRNERVRAAALASPTGESDIPGGDVARADATRLVYNAIVLPDYRALER